ncbi:MAG: hypothetical protein AAF251_02925 [Pseudomonadota bacterium]
MSRLPDEFHQDRALRDAARDVLFADVEHAKATLSGKGIAGRLAGRVGDGAKDVAEIAKVHATDKQGLLAGLIAIIALWLARGPLLEILGSGGTSEEGVEPEPTDEDSLDGDPDQDKGDLEEPDSDAQLATPGSDAHTDTKPEISDEEPLKAGETA